MAATDSRVSITPISFQVLPAEDGNHQQATGGQSSSSPPPLQASRKRQDAAALANFSMRPTYPAVTFDRVCFSVSKSQQQANFLADCLARAKYCLSLGFAGQSMGEEKVDILKSVNLNVPTGSIFGLLGPSSCGKTTLLRCLVGLLEPSSGSIGLFCQETRTFSKQPAGCCSGGDQSAGQKNLSKVPGSNVGYMPQDLGLYEDFTIRQLLTMFGQYMGMELSLIRKRIAFMRDFLDLPDADREITSLSGGQKRRVSFAIACLHMPPLIILDEPTVGVDPLLRQSIWKYLRRLADEENRTIIITTHYIEEAAQADQVALMRAGEILIQDTPRKIMQSNGCKTLEEAFLKICNNATKRGATNLPGPPSATTTGKLRPQLKFDWHDKIKCELNELMERSRQMAADSQAQAQAGRAQLETSPTDSIVRRLQEKAQEKLAIFEYLQTKQVQLETTDELTWQHQQQQHGHLKFRPPSKVISEPELSLAPINLELPSASPPAMHDGCAAPKKTSIRCLRRSKLVISEHAPSQQGLRNCDESRAGDESYARGGGGNGGNDGQATKDYRPASGSGARANFRERVRKGSSLMWALLYKNYRRNVNSLPLLAFQFMLPIIQMISFSLCIGGRPTQIGLGLVNNDQLVSYELADAGSGPTSLAATNLTLADSSGPFLVAANDTELLSTRYLSFLDDSMLAVKSYGTLSDALGDVRRGKLWAAMEIGQNFTRSISSRFDLENFYQLDLDTIRQSVIKLYPDRSNKVLDMICQRSLVNSYRQFLIDEFEHFKRLPIEVKEPIFDIKPNLISNSMDGYTESIAAGLLASLTYIMAAGLTTFIMVVERSAGILERTYTSGISPTAYLLAHAVFRSFVMMLQIGLVLFLTFYLLQQPLVGSIWLAYLMLMTLNLTGIAYGLLISSLVSDQNGAALTIVSSLVVKITMSGILWPFEAIPRWLRAICYVQPLTMPVQALKSITLKGNGLDDRTVYLGFVVSLTWLLVFLTVSARRFKFYQH